MPNAIARDRSRAASPLPAGCRDARQLAAALNRFGLQPLAGRVPDGFGGCGVTLSVSVRQLIASQSGMKALADRLRSLLTLRQSVTLCLRDAGACSSRRLDRVLYRLHRASGAPCIDRDQLGLVLSVGDLPLPAYLLMSRVQLGGGPRYLWLGSAGQQEMASRAAMNDAWSLLFQQRHRDRQLRPVLPAEARSRCPLLSDETCAGLLEPGKVCVPANAACLVLRVNLCRYADARGSVDTARLERLLQWALPLADSLFDCLYWPDPAQRRDALQNRRVVFQVEGIGDLLVLRGDDPAAARCLRQLDRLLAAMSNALWQGSRRLAMARGALPALLTRDPSRKLPAGQVRREWQRRWQQALAEAAVRHRNLLSVSPYALLPQCGAASPAHGNLLPLLKHADLPSFAGRVNFPGWTIKEYKDFHVRAASILARRGAA